MVIISLNGITYNNGNKTIHGHIFSSDQIQGKLFIAKYQLWYLVASRQGAFLDPKLSQDLLE
jgi:hypothetical protein